MKFFAPLCMGFFEFFSRRPGPIPRSPPPPLFTPLTLVSVSRIFLRERFLNFFCMDPFFS